MISNPKVLFFAKRIEAKNPEAVRILDTSLRSV